jgi:carbon monoxide dehydrogenase subunit G
MDFANEFRVSLPLEQAWDLLNDIERIAPCMPGAQLTGVDDEEYHGRVKVKVGPVTVEYNGVATVEERDAQNRTMTLNAKGRESRGQGNADALITAHLASDGEGTRVAVSTRLSVTGKVAQFGRGVMEDISKRLLDQFVSCLERQFTAERELSLGGEGYSSGTATTDAGPSAVTSSATGASTVDGSGSGARAAGEPIDLISVARGAVLKRLVPALAALLVMIGVARWLSCGRGKRGKIVT